VEIHTNAYTRLVGGDSTSAARLAYTVPWKRSDCLQIDLVKKF